MTSTENLTEPAPTTEAPTPLRDLAADDTAAAATEGRSLPAGIIDVQLEDGTEIQVRIDNRDYVRWDMTAPRQKWPSGSSVPFLFQTFLAWAGAKRQGLTALSWDQFSAACVMASMRPAEDPARPTQ